MCGGGWGGVFDASQSMSFVKNVFNLSSLEIDCLNQAGKLTYTNTNSLTYFFIFILFHRQQNSLYIAGR